VSVTLARGHIREACIPFAGVVEKTP